MGRMIYEWKCQICGETAEVERVVADYLLGPSENECACMCGAENYERILSKPNYDMETMRDKGIFERLPTF